MLRENKVTEQDIKDAVVDEFYDFLSDGKTTVCTLVLYNGFTVRGESSVVDPANFNEALGRQYARQRAANEVWPVLGAILAEKLWHARQVDVIDGRIDEFASDIAAQFAKEEAPSYYSEPFTPHDWVVKAVEYAYQFGVNAGRNSLVSQDRSEPDSPA